MNIKLEQPIAFFDLETTGLNIATDRIVSIAITKLMPDGSKEKKYSEINPTIPIPKEASDVHGITNEMIAEAPTFKQLSKGIYEFMKDCDLVGYNNNYYDNALLQEEFNRVGIDFPNNTINSIDACFIYKHFQKRDLSSALMYYCNESMDNFHNSEADTEATYNVFMAQIEKHPELEGKSMKELSDFCNPDKRVDWQSKIIVDKDGDYVYNFGGSRGTKVKNNLGFAEWALMRDFPASLKNLLRKILIELKNK